MEGVPDLINLARYLTFIRKCENGKLNIATGETSQESKEVKLAKEVKRS